MHLSDDSFAFPAPSYTHLLEVQVWALTGRTSLCLHIQRQTNCLLATVETITHNTRGSAHWIVLLFSCCHVNIPHMNHSWYSWACTVYTDLDIERWEPTKLSPCGGPKKKRIKLFALNKRHQTNGWVKEEEGASFTVRLYYCPRCFPPEAQCPWYRCWDFMCG